MTPTLMALLCLGEISGGGGEALLWRDPTHTVRPWSVGTPQDTENSWGGGILLRLQGQISHRELSSRTECGPQDSSAGR